VAIALGAVVRVTQDGRPGASVGGCERAVAQAAATALRRAARKAPHASRADARAACRPRSVPTRASGATIDRRCDDAGRVARRARGSAARRARRPADLAACGARLAASTAARCSRPSRRPALGRCLRAAASAGGALARAVSMRSSRDAETAAASCVPPPSAPETAPACARTTLRRAARLRSARASRARPVRTAADLARCLAAHAAEPVDCARERPSSASRAADDDGADHRPVSAATRISKTVPWPAYARRRRIGTGRRSRRRAAGASASAPWRAVVAPGVVNGRPMNRAPMRPVTASGTWMIVFRIMITPSATIA
jgi:hypothetical protein